MEGSFGPGGERTWETGVGGAKLHSVPSCDRAPSKCQALRWALEGRGAQTDPVPALGEHRVKCGSQGGSELRGWGR